MCSSAACSPRQLPGTRPSWKGSPPPTTPQRQLATMRPLGGRRDQYPDQDGAAGAGTSGRPWVLSRMHERGDQRMRKVITGEQVAQLYNRDPYALPVWRAPVYQTPAIVTITVQLYRLISWLVRLTARH